MFEHRPSTVATPAAAVALFAAIAVGRFVDSSPVDSIGFLFVIPVALLGAHYGWRGALIAASAAMAVVVGWSVYAGEPLTLVGSAVRVVCITVLGVVVARLVELGRRKAAESDRWFSMSTDLLCTIDMNGTYTAVNGAWTELLGYSREGLLGRTYTHFVHPDDVAQTNEVASALASANVVVNFENRYRAKNGRVYWLLWSARSDGTQIYGVAKDITERKRLDGERERLLRRVEQLAQTDPLTGIANRRAWHGQLATEILRATRSGESLAVVMLDLDGFKSVNDTLGHQAGDRLLEDCASSWLGAIRETDVLGRVGGDEFAVLLPDCDPASVEDVLRRLRDMTPAGSSVSMGCAIRNAGESGERLLRRADEELYAAKAAVAVAV